MKNQKGITLIALIVSIIVMLILVRVTVTLVYEGEVINKAGEARNLTKERAEEETNMVNEAGEGIDVAVAGRWYYLNPEPPVVTSENACFAGFYNGSLLFSLPSDFGMGVMIDSVRIQTIMAMQVDRIVEQTGYELQYQTIYFYMPVEQETTGAITSDMGVLVDMGTQTINKGWYKVIVTVKDYTDEAETDTVTVTSFEPVADIYNIKVRLSTKDDINIENGMSDTNMDLYVKSTPYEEI